MKYYFFSIRAYFYYWLRREDRFSQQSPFVFDIYSRLIGFLKANENGDPVIEQVRQSLLKEKKTIQVLDLGAGSKKVPQSFRQIANITRYSTSGAKFAQLYQFFCGLTPAKNVLELGTCVGISARYLSKKTKGTLFTFEGSPEIQKIAKRAPLPSRTKFILGPIQKNLPEILRSIPSVDFALIDANHTYEGTIQSFYSILPKIHSGSILAIGDIHWTPDMEKAWSEIKAHSSVRLTLDFFECGIVLFYFPGEKTHLILSL